MLNLDFKQAIDSLQANPVACGSLCLRALALSGKGNDKYLFTDTKTDLNGNLTADPVTWIFDTNDNQLS